MTVVAATKADGRTVGVPKADGKAVLAIAGGITATEAAVIMIAAAKAGGMGAVATPVV